MVLWFVVAIAIVFLVLAMGLDARDLLISEAVVFALLVFPDQIGRHRSGYIPQRRVLWQDMQAFWTPKKLTVSRCVSVAVFLVAFCALAAPLGRMPQTQLDYAKWLLLVWAAVSAIMAIIAWKKSQVMTR